ncbi:hypothetical protein NKR17_05615 [Priestia flexa]|uniref:hypothetical protein n=1 Tax=Priestia flexa TaxID=86664 RepID=UPI00203B9B39|nr:hypothetical protein [Priestia flexa]MCM3068480.1 hypothetical protein [Priestia flexa]MCP1188558.1 hypothetical protein [Priestia flexa]
MWKKIFILVVLGYTSLSTKYFLESYVYATTDEESVAVNEDSLSSNLSSEDKKMIFDRLYEEGYQLGEEDGSSEKPYENFNGSQSLDYTTEESQWFVMGYTVGYEKAKRTKEDATNAIKEQEASAGEQAGYQQGLEDYKHATVAYNPPQTPAKSTEWNKGFSLGYTKAIQVMDLSIKAKKDGHTQGLEGEALNMPELYSANELTRKAYEEGFQSGQKEQVEKLKKEYKQEGYKQGYALQTLSVPSGLSSEVAAAFEQGYSKGEKQRHKDVRQEGFNAAFTYTTHHSPSAYQTNTRLLESYKEGFQSNQVASQLRKDAYEEGWKLGHTMTIPAKYKHTKPAVAVYKQYYDLGQKKQKQTVFEIFVVVLILISGIGAYTLFGRKRNRQEAFDLEENTEGIGVK